MQISLPATFYWDHVERDLPGGIVLTKSKSKVKVEVTDEELAEILSDARYYASDGRYMGPNFRGVTASAKATVRAIENLLKG